MFNTEGTQKNMGLKRNIMIICGDTFRIMKKKKEKKKAYTVGPTVSGTPLRGPTTRKVI